MKVPIRVKLAEIELMTDDSFEIHVLETIQLVSKGIEVKADPATMKILADNMKDITV